MKYFYLILVIAYCSCSKHSDDKDNYGDICGSITAYDKTGKVNQQFADISIKLIDKQNQVSVETVEADGRFQFEKIIKGDVLLIFNKPGYGYIDTIKFDHEMPNDTLSNVQLVEDLPFNIKNNYVSYPVDFRGSTILEYSISSDYRTTDQYMVGFLICLSKTPDVSLTKANMVLNYGSYTSVQVIRGVIRGNTFSYQRFFDAGFKLGDTIYAAIVPVAEKYSMLYYANTQPNQKQNYEIISCKSGNTSNVTSFILK